MTKTPAEIRAAFARFRSAYPPRPENGWTAAFAVFERLAKKGADLDDLVKAAGLYRAFTNANVPEPKFIPMARRWLAEGRYHDFLEEAPASAAEPSPEPPAHPLAWLQVRVPESAWRSWLAALDVTEGSPTTIIAPTQFTLDHVKGEWGHLLRRHYGDVAWGVRKKA